MADKQIPKRRIAAAGTAVALTVAAIGVFSQNVDTEGELRAARADLDAALAFEPRARVADLIISAQGHIDTVLGPSSTSTTSIPTTTAPTSTPSTTHHPTTTATTVPTTVTTAPSVTSTTSDPNFTPSPQVSRGSARPGWIVSCNYSHSNNDDPIVFPGVPGAAHLHDFAAATTTNAASTPDTLRAGPTTCAVEADHAAYWIPAAYKNGVRLLPQGTSRNALFYYRKVTNQDVQTIPDGLEMIIGNQHATSASQVPQLGSDIIFKCGPGSSTNLPRPPTQCDSGIMVLSVRFPSCWDGVRLDSPDHRSHMAYPGGGGCPASHPVAIPRVESFFRYNVGTGPIGEITFSSGPYYTVHQDFFNAWRPQHLQALVTNCMNAELDCGTNPTP